MSILYDDGSSMSIGGLLSHTKLQCYHQKPAMPSAMPTDKILQYCAKEVQSYASKDQKGGKGIAIAELANGGLGFFRRFFIDELTARKKAAQEEVFDLKTQLAKAETELEQAGGEGEDSDKVSSLSFRLFDVQRLVAFLDRDLEEGKKAFRLVSKGVGESLADAYNGVLIQSHFKSPEDLLASVRETVTEANAAKDSAESALAAEQATEASLTEQVHALSEMSEGYYSQLVQAKHTITQLTSQLDAATAATAAAAAAAAQQQLAAAVAIMAAAGLDTSAFTGGQESSVTMSEKPCPEPKITPCVDSPPAANTSSSSSSSNSSSSCSSLSEPALSATPLDLSLLDLQPFTPDISAAVSPAAAVFRQWSLSDGGSSTSSRRSGSDGGCGSIDGGSSGSRCSSPTPSLDVYLSDSSDSEGESESESEEADSSSGGWFSWTAVSSWFGGSSGSSSSSGGYGDVTLLMMP